MGAARADRLVAVVGLSCRLPQAQDPDALWELLRSASSAVTGAGAGRWPGAADPRVHRGGFLDRVDAFDPGFFGIAPREAVEMDPQQRLALELSWEALEDAGIVPGTLHGEPVPVYVGVMADDYAKLRLAGAGDDLDRYTQAGTQRALIANRISHFLGVHGESMAVDTGQSSSLVAVHLACEALLSGRATAALAGGVQLNLLEEPALMAAKLGTLSADGQCFTFDARADGYVRGEGGGFVVLKTLDRAEADGDDIYAVIRGTATNTGGSERGLSVPSAAAQEAVLRAAYERAGADPAQVQYVELHGTGTRVGDPIEAEALGAVLGRGRPASRPLVVGSVKTNIGHLEGAAGIAGLLKTVLMIRHRAVAASLNFASPNPDIAFDEWRLRVATSSSPWPEPAEPLLAGVSSFGIGGSNCHVVLSSAPVPASAAPEPASAGVAPGDAGPGVVPLVLSGTSDEAVRGQAARLLARLEADPGLRPVDAGWSLVHTRAAFDHRAVVVGDREALRFVVPGVARADGRVGALFTGQGAQRIGMARELYESSEVFASAVDAIVAELGLPLLDVMWGDDPELINQTGWAQPALFVVEAALFEVLRSYGVTPSFLLGHSIGELTAAYVSGMWSLADACRVVAARARLMQALPAGGAMATIEMPEGDVPEGVSVAAVNTAGSVVVSGPQEAVDALIASATGKVTRLRVSHAFHSALMDPMLEDFAAVLATVEFRAPRIPIVSNLTGAPDDAMQSADYWVRQVRGTVRFADGVRWLAEQGVSTLVELGPDGVLSGLVPDSVPMLRRKHDDRTAVLTAVGHLWTHGVAVDWDPAFAGADPRRVALPTYAFQRERYWPGVVPGSRPAPAAPPVPVPPSSSVPAPSSLSAPAPSSVSAPVAEGQSLRDLVREAAAVVLGHRPDTPLDTHRTFRELGFDSLSGVELRNLLQSRTGVELPSSAVFDYPTVARLADHLAGGSELAPPPAPADVTGDPIVLVGMACRFPGGVSGPDALWRLVADETDAIGPFPADRGWDLDRLRSVSATDRGGFVDGADGFDAAFFRISPREALATDPQQRLLLEVSWEALEQAGIDPGTLAGSPTGVFAGAYGSGYGDLVSREQLQGHLLTGGAGSVISGRVAYALGLEGPAVSVDTACSSSLVAMHLAAQALRAGECSLALAGGVSVMATPEMFLEFTAQNGLSADGRCKSFSDTADGTGWSEGVGMVVLERLSDARRNGHDVLAIMRSSAVNQDGASNGLTAPNGPSQQRVIRQALAAAGLSPADVDAVEAHGTGTRLGDPIEAQALLATYGQDRDHPLWLGSLKSNIGHTQAAAGVGGVIKMVQALRHGVLPKTLHVEEPTSQVDWEQGDVRLLTEAIPWPDSGRPRRAGVSSFGVSGTNAHVILEAPESPAAITAPPAPDDEGVVPWVLSGTSDEAVRAQATRLLAHVEQDLALRPVDVAWSLLTSRAALGHRAAVVGAGRDELLAGLRATVAGEVVPRAARPGGKVVFVFPGQGAQWVGMARELLGASPVFAASMDACAEALDPFVDWSLPDVLGDEAALQRVDIVQPALWAVMVSLAAVWRSFGVEPAAVIGHSQGEIAAACVAGALSLSDGARVVALRSRAIGEQLTGGGMMALSVPAAAAEQLIADRPGLSLAVVNGPAATVVSGDAHALDLLQAHCDEQGIQARRIAVDYASHSELVERIQDRLLTDLDPIRPQSSTIPVISSVTGEPMDTAAWDAAYWYRNLRSTVLFEQALTAAAADLVVEVSPHPVLLPVVQDVVPVVGTLRRGEGGWRQLVSAVAQAHAYGAEVDWTPVFAGRG
uniref:type I polyketide synthase n=1 Tax=Symbioplanes lichenis TaxID=1629072 RepID=UPI0027393CBF